MAAADSCPKTGGCFQPPRRRLRKRSPPADAEQVSPDKYVSFHRANAAFTLCYWIKGLCHVVLTRPIAKPFMRFVFLAPQLCAPASFIHILADVNLPSTIRSLY
jgi:hypothetical protein